MSSTTALICAIRQKNNAKASVLLNGVSCEEVNGVDTHGSSALHWACRHNNHHLVSQLLAIPGILVNVKNLQGQTAVMWSVACCSVDALKIMLKDDRVDIEEEDKDGDKLEDLVGYCESTILKKNECLSLIKDAKARKMNIKVLENLRANVRSKYIQEIEEMNQHARNKEKLLNEKLDRGRLKMRELRETQDLERKALDEKHQGEKSKLEGLLRMEVGNDEEELVHMKKTIDHMVNDLENFDPETGSSMNDKAKIKDAMESLTCPICMELMKPPVQIWMCPASHIVCEACKHQLVGQACPSCRTKRVTLRALIVEQFARTIFKD